jgi:hypothetical protein
MSEDVTITVAMSRNEKKGITNLARAGMKIK